MISNSSSSSSSSSCYSGPVMHQHSHAKQLLPRRSLRRSLSCKRSAEFNSLSSSGSDEKRRRKTNGQKLIVNSTSLVRQKIVGGKSTENANEQCLRWVQKQQFVDVTDNNEDNEIFVTEKALCKKILTPSSKHASKCTDDFLATTLTDSNSKDIVENNNFTDESGLLDVTNDNFEKDHLYDHPCSLYEVAVCARKIHDKVVLQRAVPEIENNSDPRLTEFIQQKLKHLQRMGILPSETIKSISDPSTISIDETDSCVGLPCKISPLRSSTISNKMQINKADANNNLNRCETKNKFLPGNVIRNTLHLNENGDATQVHNKKLDANYNPSRQSGVSIASSKKEQGEITFQISFEKTNASVDVSKNSSGVACVPTEKNRKTRPTAPVQPWNVLVEEQDSDDCTKAFPRHRTVLTKPPNELIFDVELPPVLEQVPSPPCRRTPRKNSTNKRSKPRFLLYNRLQRQPLPIGELPAISEALRLRTRRKELPNLLPLGTKSNSLFKKKLKHAESGSKTSNSVSAVSRDLKMTNQLKSRMGSVSSQNELCKEHSNDVQNSTANFSHADTVGNKQELCYCVITTEINSNTHATITAGTKTCPKITASVERITKKTCSIKSNQYSKINETSLKIKSKCSKVSQRSNRRKKSRRMCLRLLLMPADNLSSPQPVRCRRSKRVVRRHGEKDAIIVMQDDIERYLQLLDSDFVIRELLRRDCHRLYADNYLLAMVFVYFLRAGLQHHRYDRLHFLAALYLAHDVEEDDESLKEQVVMWLVTDTSLPELSSSSSDHCTKLTADGTTDGYTRDTNGSNGEKDVTTSLAMCPRFCGPCRNHRNQRYIARWLKHALLKTRDQLFWDMDCRAIVSRASCRMVMEFDGVHPVWQRQRSERHAHIVSNCRRTENRGYLHMQLPNKNSTAVVCSLCSAEDSGLQCDDGDEIWSELYDSKKKGNSVEPERVRDLELSNAVDISNKKKSSSIEGKDSGYECFLTISATEGVKNCSTADSLTGSRHPERYGVEDCVYSHDKLDSGNCLIRSRGTKTRLLDEPRSGTSHDKGTGISSHGTGMFNSPDVSRRQPLPNSGCRRRSYRNVSKCRVTADTVKEEFFHRPRSLLAVFAKLFHLEVGGNDRGNRNTGQMPCDSAATVLTNEQETTSRTEHNQYGNESIYEARYAVHSQESVDCFISSSGENSERWSQADTLVLSHGRLRGLSEPI